MNQLIRISALVLILATGLAFSTAARAEAPSIDSPRAVTVLQDIYVRFKVKVFGLARIVGRFDRLHGEMISDSNGQGTDIHMHIYANSLTTDDTWRDEFLRGPGFFSTEYYPHITFSGSCLSGKQGEAGRIVGDLSLHGITRRVSFEVNMLRAPTSDRSGVYQATAIIRRSDFGLNTLKHVVSDEVEIVVAMNADGDA